MSRKIFETLLSSLKEMHQGNAALSAFCPFPGDIRAQDVTANLLPAAGLIGSDAGLETKTLKPQRDAILAAAQHAHWHESYQKKDVGAEFLARFGVYCVIGRTGPFVSDEMRAWIVYMPARLHYPWHHHKAEEMYMAVAGEAEFSRKGHAPGVLRPGETVLHESNQPHATDTFEAPLLAYVIWRNGFDDGLALTSAEQLA